MESHDQALPIPPPTQQSNSALVELARSSLSKLTSNIGLVSELLLDRYQMLPPEDPNNPIARHEISLLPEAKTLLQQSVKGKYRSDCFNRDILPLVLPWAEAVGHRMAVEAAHKAGIDSKLLELYISGFIKEDPAWYAEKGGLSRGIQREMEYRAADALLPYLECIMRDSGLQAYSNAPMESRGLWDEFVSGLETFEGNASPQLLAYFRAFIAHTCKLLELCNL